MTHSFTKSLRTLALTLCVAALLFALHISPSLAQRTPINDARAAEIVLQAVPGRVIAVEREHGAIEVLVRAHDGTLKEVTLDARTGRVLEIEDESEHEEGAEREGYQDDDQREYDDEGDEDHEDHEDALGEQREARRH